MYNTIAPVAAADVRPEGRSSGLGPRAHFDYDVNIYQSFNFHGQAKELVAWIQEIP